MNAFIWILVAFVSAALLFSSIQDELPDELSFLKGDQAAVQTVGAGAAPVGVTSVSQVQGWTVRKNNLAVELSKAFSGEIVVNGTPYAAPEIGILCNQGALDIRLDTRMATTGRKTTPVKVSGLGKQTWEKSASTNIFPKDAKPLLRLLVAQPAVAITLSYTELGLQSTSLDTAGLAALVQELPEACR